MSITALPTAPARSQAPATFITNADAWVAALSTFTTEANALAAAMNAVSAGGAMTIPYTFSTTTTDADPGNGFLRLDNATQNTATTIRADLVGTDGTTWTSVIDTFDDSTSTITGQIRLFKASDASKWLIFNVTALASPSGYKNITVANVSGSAASPFTNGDSICLTFTRTGDKGTTGNNGANGTNGGLTLLATLTPTAAAAVNALTTFTSSYDAYVIVGEGIAPSANDKLQFQFAVAGTLDTGSNYYATPNYSSSAGTSATASGQICGVAAANVGTSGKGLTFVLNVVNANDATSGIKTLSASSVFENSTANNYNAINLLNAYIAANAISGIGFFWASASNFKAQGKIRIYGHNNT